MVLMTKPKNKPIHNIMKLSHSCHCRCGGSRLLCNTTVRAADEPEAVASVLKHYLTIQTNLANDSVKTQRTRHRHLKVAIKGDPMKSRTAPDVAKQAETLAQAKDLKAAREAQAAQCLAGQISGG